MITDFIENGGASYSTDDGDGSGQWTMSECPTCKQSIRAVDMDAHMDIHSQEPMNAGEENISSMGSMATDVNQDDANHDDTTTDSTASAMETEPTTAPPPSLPPPPQPTAAPTPTPTPAPTPAPLLSTSLPPKTAPPPLPTAAGMKAKAKPPVMTPAVAKAKFGGPRPPPRSDKFLKVWVCVQNFTHKQCQTHTHTHTPCTLR
eukprot:gnl/Hemi2/23198_TR7777_c0_g8_i1.p1 gnl/Hemi2/23198_TR7777_c0_g8~~gnl/Hemi2/23198_TR7777_c0_g8_i1.p1  ORF type:complete len:203 (+),score=50.17 gnl/Hemi2/23198_TR7777_c0_g8_i1:91-699(+)